MSEEQSLPLVTRSHGLHVRAVHEAARRADFIASTDAVDAYGEIVEQSWDLERFMTNPVVLYAHNSRELPIGICTMCAVLDGKLQCTVEFATAEMNPKAEQVWRMVQAKMLRAVSVGFVPKSYRYEKRDGEDVIVLADNELHEISVVPIPANPEALAKMKTLALASKNQAASVATETTMTEIDHKARAEKAESELRSERDAHAAATRDLDALRKTLAAVESQNAALVAERDQAVERAAKAEDALIEAEVSALVGVKITPAEKDDFVALRKSNPALYEKFVAQRADAKLLAPVMAAAPIPAPSATAADVEIDLFAEAASA